MTRAAPLPCVRSSHLMMTAARHSYFLFRTLRILLLLTFTIGARAQDLQSYQQAPIGEALRAQKGELYGITGTVTLVLAPGYVFLQDESGAIRLVLRNPPQTAIVLGDRLHAVVRNTGTPGRWFEAVRVESLGPAALPVPELITPATATSQKYDAAFVTVRGRVTAHFRNNPSYEIDGKRVTMPREVLLVDCDGGSVEVIFDPVDQPFERFPVGTRAEFTGASRFPDGPTNIEGPLFSVSVRGTERVRVLELPPVWMRPEFRVILVRVAWGVGIALVFLIAWLLWRWRRRQLARVSEMRFRTLVESSFDGVLVFKPDGGLLYRNPGAVRLFGETLPGDMLMQNGSFPKIHPEDAPRILAAMKDLLAEPGHTSSRIAYRVHVQDGSMRYVEAIGTNCIDVPGIEGVVINVRDITDRQEAEERLREANATLEQRVALRTEDLTRTQEELRAALKAEQELSELRANFVSLVSHEFRTPLGVIMSAADVLRLFYRDLPDEKRAHHLAMITRSTRTLANLIEEVLLIRRVEEGKQRFEPVPVQLAQLASALADEVHSAHNGVCPIQLTCEGQLDGAMSDETLLRHILCNLLSNAIKYSDPGQTVEFRVERHADDAILTVKDHGIGILPEDRSRLFDSFMRGRNVGTRPGTGLGLIVVKRCVDLHGGSLNLESEPGHGTCVTITLPVFKSQD